MSARPATAFVLLVWAAMLVWLHVYIGSWGARFPIGDELSLWDLLRPLGDFTWRRIFTPHNEHFIPLPKLIHFALYRLTGDLRPAMFLQAELLGSIALGMIWLVRRVRGRTEWSDAVFPLLLLHSGDAGNLLCGFQLALTLPVALASWILVASALSTEVPRPARALWIGSCLFALPLCGGAGNLQAPAWIAWTAWIGWRGLRSAEPDRRPGAWILLASAVVCLAISVAGAVLVHGRLPPAATAPTRDVLLHAAAMLSLGIGPAAIASWPASAWFVAALALPTIGMLVGGLQREPREAIRRVPILASILGVLCLALGASALRARLGWQNGFMLRYATLTTPLVCAVYVAWTAYGGRIAGASVRALMAAVALAALPANTRIGHAVAVGQRAHAEELENLVQRGAPAAEIVRCYADNFFVHPIRSRPVLQLLAAQRRPPFEREPPYPAALFDWLPFDRAPTSIEGEVPNSLRFVDDEWVLLARSGTRIHLAVHASETHCTARIAVPRELVGRRFSTGTRARIEIAEAGGGLRTLYEHELGPPQVVELDLGSHGECELVLTTESVAGDRAERSWIYWMDVAIR